MFSCCGANQPRCGLKHVSVRDREESLLYYSPAAVLVLLLCFQFVILFIYSVLNEAEWRLCNS